MDTMRIPFVSLMLLLAAPAVLAADVGFSLSIGQPGFYGQLDLGDAPPPRVLYRQPMMIGHGQAGQEPVYLRVPPGQARNWRRHCGKYKACNQPVMFVRDDWYRNEYSPRYREQHRDRDGRGHPDNRGEGGRNDRPEHGRNR
jgi:hypothetical protein